MVGQSYLAKQSDSNLGLKWCTGFLILMKASGETPEIENQTIGSSHRPTQRGQILIAHAGFAPGIRVCRAVLQTVRPQAFVKFFIGSQNSLIMLVQCLRVHVALRETRSLGITLEYTFL